MTDCPNAEIRDLLPDLVHRTLSDGDAARVTAHLGSCADCQAEVALLRASAAVLRTRPAVDVAAIVRALPAPPAAAAPRLVLDGARPIARETGFASPRRRAVIRWGLVAAAAAAAIAVAATVRDSASSVRLRDDSTLIVEGRDSLAPAPLAPAAPDSARDALPAPVPSVVPAPRQAPPTRLAMSMEGGPDDLTDAELERLIGGLETLDGMPNVDPDESVDPIGGGGGRFE